MNVKSAIKEELERQGAYCRDDGDYMVIDGHIDLDAFLRVIAHSTPKVALVPCPFPQKYDRGDCCGECVTDAEVQVENVRKILTEWNFGPMPDRRALELIHAFIGDNIQESAALTPKA